MNEKTNFEPFSELCSVHGENRSAEVCFFCRRVVQPVAFGKLAPADVQNLFGIRMLNGAFRAPLFVTNGQFCEGCERKGSMLILSVDDNILTRIDRTIPVPLMEILNEDGPHIALPKTDAMLDMAAELFGKDASEKLRDDSWIAAPRRVSINIGQMLMDTSRRLDAPVSVQVVQLVAETIN